jgi:hypothetical protein
LMSELRSNKYVHKRTFVSSITQDKSPNVLFTVSARMAQRG